MDGFFEQQSAIGHTYFRVLLLRFEVSISITFQVYLPLKVTDIRYTRGDITIFNSNLEVISKEKNELSHFQGKVNSL